MTNENKPGANIRAHLAHLATSASNAGAAGAGLLVVSALPTGTHALAARAGQLAVALQHSPEALIAHDCVSPAPPAKTGAALTAWCIAEAVQLYLVWSRSMYASRHTGFQAMPSIVSR